MMDRLDAAATIPLVEEKAVVSAREAVTGRVRVSAKTDTFAEVVRQDLRGMRAEVVRMPVNRTLEAGEAPPQPRTEGDVMIIPIFEEVILVEKRLVLKEELHITQQVTTETVDVPVDLRRQRAVVERLSTADETEPNKERTMSDATTMSRNEYVAAFFDNEADAEAAVARIAAEGIPRDQIRMVAGEADTGLEIDTIPSEPREKGFFGALADLFMPEDDRYAYAEGLSRGGFLVSLTTTPENRDRILDILDDEGTVDMDAREESWRAEGWQGYQTSEPAMRTGMAEASTTAPRSEPLIDAPGEGTIEVVEEKLRVAKRDSEQGRVRVRSYVVETPVEEEVSLRGETVQLERRPVDRAVDSGAASAFVDRTIEATETSEQAVVYKEARVTEEISLGKAVDTRTETIRDTVRHTEVEVEDDRLDRDK